MYDTLDFFGGILLGTFLGSLATLVYHVRQIHQEARQNYVRLSLAQAEVSTLERTLEMYRGNSIANLTQPMQNPTVPESEVPNTFPLILPRMANCEDRTAGAMTSEPASRTGET